MAFDYSTVDMNAILRRCHDQMTPLQRPGVAKARDARGGIIFDVWMGVGKTFMSLVSGLIHRPQVTLIIASKNAVTAWKNNIKEWLPEFSAPEKFCNVKGQQNERYFAWKQALKPDGPLFFMVSAASFIRDLDYIMKWGIKFDVIWCDEPQKWGLRNEKSGAWKALKAINDKKYYPVKLLCILTGTLTSKGVLQLWQYLYHLNRDQFSSKWKFLGMYADWINGPFGREFLGPKNQERLALETGPYIYRVSEKDAMSELPPLTRRKLPFVIDKATRVQYNTMAHESYMEAVDEMGSEGLFIAKNHLARTMKLRQLITCPTILLPELGVGKAIEAICDKIMENEELPYFRHTVIFTPFVPSINLFKPFVAEMLGMPLGSILTMQGGMSPDEVNNTELLFRKNKETLVICSTMYAQSFNLETSFNCYHAHFSWDQDDNKQAEARVRRQTSDKARPVMSYYATCMGSVSEDMFYVINRKESGNKATYKDFQRIYDNMQRGIQDDDA